MLTTLLLIVVASPGAFSSGSALQTRDGLDVKVDPEEAEIKVGGSLELTASATLDGNPVEAVFFWSLERPGIATLDRTDGPKVVLGLVARGEIRIRVEGRFGAEKDETVARVLSGGGRDLYLEIGFGDLTLTVGETIDLEVDCTNRYAYWVDAAYTWKAIGSALSVEGHGRRAKLLAVAPGSGELRITGTFAGESDNASVSVTVLGQGPAGPPGPVGPTMEQLLVVFGAGTAAMAAVLLIGSEAVLFALTALLLPLFTRIKRERTLDHFVRGQIYQFIKLNPGMSYSTIKRNLDLRNGTLTYHLRMLQAQRFIRSERDGLHRFFYPADTPGPKAKVVWLSSTQVKLASVVIGAPGATQAEIVKSSGLSQQVVSYNLLAMERTGVTRVVREGRTARYWYLEKGTEDAPAEERDGFEERSPKDSDANYAPPPD